VKNTQEKFESYPQSCEQLCKTVEIKLF